MNLTRLSLTTLFFVLSFFPAQLLAEIQKIARIGEPAIGFPDGMVFAGLENPIIGRSGHIAFTGSASNGGSLRFAVGRFDRTTECNHEEGRYASGLPCKC